MKKAYNAPQLTVHGNVEQLTQAQGPAAVKDFIIVGGNPLGVPTDGSADIIVP